MNYIYTIEYSEREIKAHKQADRLSKKLSEGRKNSFESERQTCKTWFAFVFLRIGQYKFRSKHVHMGENIINEKIDTVVLF